MFCFAVFNYFWFLICQILYHNLHPTPPVLCRFSSCDIVGRAQYVPRRFRRLRAQRVSSDFRHVSTRHTSNKRDDDCACTTSKARLTVEVSVPRQRLSDSALMWWCAFCRLTRHPTAPCRHRHHPTCYRLPAPHQLCL